MRIGLGMFRYWTHGFTIPCFLGVFLLIGVIFAGIVVAVATRALRDSVEEGRTIQEKKGTED